MDPNKPRYIPVKGTKFVRDTTNGALLNTDIDELNNYKIRKQLRDTEKKEKNMMKQKIDKLETDISDIKDMLSHLLNLGSKNAD